MQSLDVLDTCVYPNVSLYDVLLLPTRWHSIFLLCSSKCCSQFSNYIPRRHCNPILNLLCRANIVPPIAFVDEESFCHYNVYSISLPNLYKSRSTEK